MRIKIIRKRSAVQLFFGAEGRPAASANSIAAGRPSWYKTAVKR
jgi:hypothetical protein